MISYKDILLARFMDKTFEDYKQKKENPHSKRKEEEEENEFRDKIRNLIANDNLEEASDKLIEFATLNQENEIIDEITLIMGKLNRVRKSERIGEIARETEDIEYNRIRKSILELLKK